MQWHVFCLNGKTLAANMAVKLILNHGTEEWRGDIVVMKKGRKEQFVSANSKDRSKVNFVVRKSVYHLHTSVRGCN